MKNVLIAVLALFVVIACENKNDNNEELTKETNLLVGEWKLVEQNVSIGGPSTWQPVEDGETFTLKADGTFSGFQLFSDCNTGAFEATEEELILEYNCSDDTKPFTYFLTREDDAIILSPKTIICTESCEYKYRKIGQ